MPDDSKQNRPCVISTTNYIARGANNLVLMDKSENVCLYVCQSVCERQQSSCDGVTASVLSCSAKLQLTEVRSFA